MGGELGSLGALMAGGECYYRREGEKEKERTGGKKGKRQ